MKFKSLILLIVFSSTSSFASTWTYLAHSPSGAKSFALETTSSKLFPVIWYKSTNVNGHTTSLSKDVFDCKKEKFSIKETTEFTENGDFKNSDTYIFNSWQEIKPDTISEYEYKFACHHDLLF